MTSNVCAFERSLSVEISIGPGVREIRIRDKSGAFRVIYLATVQDLVLVLHAFQKKSQATAQKDIDLAAKRLRAWRKE